MRLNVCRAVLHLNVYLFIETLKHMCAEIVFFYREFKKLTMLLVEVKYVIKLILLYSRKNSCYQLEIPPTYFNS